MWDPLGPGPLGPSPLGPLNIYYRFYPFPLCLSLPYSGECRSQLFFCLGVQTPQGFNLFHTSTTHSSFTLRCEACRLPGDESFCLEQTGQEEVMSTDNLLLSADIICRCVSRQTFLVCRYVFGETPIMCLQRNFLCLKT